MSYIPSSGSVVAYQPLPSSLLTGASIIGLTPVNVTVMPSVYGAVQIEGSSPTSIVAAQRLDQQVVGSSIGLVTHAVLHGLTAAGGGAGNYVDVKVDPSGALVTALGSVVSFQGTSPWVTGNSSVMLTAGTNIVGSVATLQGTNPWNVATNNNSVIGVFDQTPSIVGTYIDTNTATSVRGIAIMFKKSDSTSIMSAVSPNFPLPVANSSVQLTAGTNVVGSVAVLQSTNPWVVGNSSVMLTQGTNTIGSVTVIQGTNPWINAGSSVQVVGIMPVQSVLLIPGGNAFGSVATLQGTNPWVIGNSSVMLTQGTNTVGSVAVLQGTNPWAVVTPGSVVTVWKDSSVLAGLTSTNASIVGTYAEDTIHTSGDKGFFMLGVRTDNMASIASAALDYAVHAVDSSGRTLTKPFTSDDATLIEYTGSVTSTSVTVIKPSAVGQRSYITDFWIANTSSVSTLVTFKDGSTSILGQTIAPAGGGSNAPGINLPMRTNRSQDLTFSSGTAASILYVTVRGYQAPG